MIGRGSLGRGGWQIAAVLIAGAALAGLLLGGPLFGGSRAFGAGAAGQPRTLRLDVRFQDSFVEVAGPGFVPGNQIILNDRLLSEGEEAGQISGVCTVTAPGETACAMIFVLRDGTVTAQLFNTPPPVKTFAITGGTGAYRGARGEGVLVENGDGPEEGGGGTGSVTLSLAARYRPSRESGDAGSGSRTGR
jgi:hypothetical protein